MTRTIAIALLGALWAVPAHALRTEGPQGTGLEELERGLKRVRYKPTRPKHQLIVVGPGAPGIVPLLFQAQAAIGRRHRFVILVDTPADRDRMIQWLTQENVTSPLSSNSDWKSWVISIDKESDETYEVAYRRAVLDILKRLRPIYRGPALMLLVQASREPNLTISGVKQLRIPITGEAELQKMLASLFEGYGVHVRVRDIRDVIKHRFRELQYAYSALEQQA